MSADLSPLTKFCRDCGETKPFGEFHRNRSASDGLVTYCKPCMLDRVNRSRAKKRAAMGEDAWKAHNRSIVAAHRARTGNVNGRAYMRARGAAMEALARRHRKEFEHLLLLARRDELVAAGLYQNAVGLPLPARAPDQTRVFTNPTVGQLSAGGPPAACGTLATVVPPSHRSDGRGVEQDPRTAQLHPGHNLEVTP